MQLQFIDLGKLVISKANMRHGKKAPDVSDILPTIRARGVLVPLIVRSNSAPNAVEPQASEGQPSEPDQFEIIAGARRFTAAKRIAEEGGSAEPLPCAILDDGDDAAAIEASLIENVARRDPLGHVAKPVLLVVMRGRPTAALTQRAGGGRPAPRIAQRCLIAA